jgi:hypothetical protein
MQFRLRNSQPLKVVDRTSLSFIRDDLMALARLVQASQVLLADDPGSRTPQTSDRSPALQVLLALEPWQEDRGILDEQWRGTPKDFCVGDAHHPAVIPIFRLIE